MERPTEKQMQAVAAELQAIMERHNMGGEVILMGSGRTHSVHVFPSWIGILPAQNGDARIDIDVDCDNLELLGTTLAYVRELRAAYFKSVLMWQAVHAALAEAMRQAGLEEIVTDPKNVQ